MTIEAVHFRHESAEMNEMENLHDVTETKAGLITGTTTGGTRGASRMSAILVFATAAALTAYPPIAALVRDGLLGAFRYFAADSFYYLSIAAHSTSAEFYTFDGHYPTNGFHPLWQFYLERSFWLFDLGDDRQVWFTAISGIALTSIGTGLFALAVLRLTGRPALTLLATVPGAFYLLTPRFDAFYGAQWSFVNGMETPLSIFFFGVLALFLVARDPLRATSGPTPLVLISIILTLVTLSRLDDVFIFAPFILYVFATGGSRNEGLRRVAAISFFPFLAIGLYLAFNLSYADSALPSSGSAKAQPIRALVRNVYALVTTLLPIVNSLFGRLNSVWSAEAWRVTQMVVPAVASLWWLARHRIRAGRDSAGARTPADTLVGLLAAYVVIKAAYNFSTVGLWDQGHWYYALSIMTANLVVAVGLGRFLDRRVAAHAEPGLLDEAFARWPRLRSLPAASIAAMAVLLVSANTFIDLKRQPGLADRNFEFWQEREATQATLDRICPGCGVLSFDDGIVAYALQDVSTLNGLGLVLDAEGIHAMQNGRLLELARDRGYHLFTSVNYTSNDPSEPAPGDYSRYIPINMSMAAQSFDDWNLEVVHTNPTSRVSFVRFTPKRGPRR